MIPRYGDAQPLNPHISATGWRAAPVPRFPPLGVRRGTPSEASPWPGRRPSPCGASPWPAVRGTAPRASPRPGPMQAMARPWAGSPGAGVRVGARQEQAGGPLRPPRRPAPPNPPTQASPPRAVSLNMGGRALLGGAPASPSGGWAPFGRPPPSGARPPAALRRLEWPEMGHAAATQPPASPGGGGGFSRPAWPQVGPWRAGGRAAREPHRPPSPPPAHDAQHSQARPRRAPPRPARGGADGGVWAGRPLRAWRPGGHPRGDEPGPRARLHPWGRCNTPRAGPPPAHTVEMPSLARVCKRKCVCVRACVWPRPLTGLGSGGKQKAPGGHGCFANPRLTKASAARRAGQTTSQA